MDHRGSSDLVQEVLEELHTEINKLQADYLSGWMKRAALRAIEAKIDEYKSKARKKW